MSTYNWDCKTVDVHPSKSGEKNVIYNVHWKVTGISDSKDENDNPYSATSIGTQNLEFVSGSDFTEFDKLSHATIVNWVKEEMGADQVKSIEEGLDSSITEIQTPTSVTLVIEEGE